MLRSAAKLSPCALIRLLAALLIVGVPLAVVAALGVAALGVAERCDRDES